MAKCRVCKEPYKKLSMAHVTCSPECVIKWIEIQRAKQISKANREDRKTDKERRQKLKTRSDYIKECQIEFNAFIRARDKDKACICCGVPLGKDAIGGGYDCGHYRSVGSAPHLRFNPDNAHGQNKKCNRWGAGRAVDYRLGLIERIGLDRVLALESNNETVKFSIEDLIAMKLEFRKLRKGIENG